MGYFIFRFLIATVAAFGVLVIAVFVMLESDNQGSYIPATLGAATWIGVFRLLRRKKTEPEIQKTIFNQAPVKVYQEKIERERGKTVNGLREGDWDFFTEEGEYIETKTYRNGRVIG